MKKIKIPFIRVALILLLVVVVTAQISTGLSAKFISKSEGTSVGRVAHFEAGSVEAVDVSSTTTYSEDTATDGYHVFVASAKLSFPENEVAREFELTMQIKNDTASAFACPAKVYQLQSCGGSSAVDLSTLGVSSNITLNPNKAYVAYSKGDAEVVWHEVDPNPDGSVSLSSEAVSVGMGEESYNVKVLYFKTFENADNSSTSSVSISFGLKTDQVD